MRSRTNSRRGAASTILLSILFVALVTVAAGSTVVAMRTMKERDKAKQNFELARAAIERSSKAMTATKGNSDNFKDQLLPLVEYYEKFAQTYAKDPEMLPEVTEAEFRTAGLRARLGMKESLDSLRWAVNHLGEMNKADFPPERFPSFSACALSMAKPMEWLMIKGSSFNEPPMAHGMQLALTMKGVTSQLDELHKKHPQAIVFREDLAGVNRAAGTLLASYRKTDALQSWLKACDLLDGLVREQPANDGYKTQLVESLTAAGDLQVGEKQADKAIPNYKRAIEISEQLAQAKPDDKSIPQGLEKAKKGLVKAESAAGAAADKADAKPESDTKKPGDSQAAVSGPAQ